MQLKIRDILKKLTDYFFGSYFGRIRIVVLFFIFLFLVLFIRMIDVFFIKSRTEGLAKDTNLSLKTNGSDFDVERNDIVDRNGELLARNLPAANLYLKTDHIFDIDSDLKKLTKVFPRLSSKIDQIKADFEDRKQNKSKSLIPIKKNILPMQQKEILDEGVVGAYFEKSWRRVYLHKNIASHLIGSVFIDNRGASGVERFFDERLADVSQGALTLSININTQSLVRDILLKNKNKYNAKGAFGLIMNVKTGELISAVSLPDFNPNNVLNYDSDLILNRFSFGLYELGSVFKIFLIAAAVKKKISLTKKYHISDSYKIDNFVIKDFRFSLKRDFLTIPEIFEYSSNIGCGQVLEDIGIEDYKFFINDLGMGDKLGLEVSEKSIPLLPSKWTGANAVTISYGHGIAVTPLHFVSAVSAIVNGGKMLQPTILKIDRKNKAKINWRVFSSEDSQKVREVLRLSSGKNRFISKSRKYYDSGGKSGTAIQVENGKYNRKKMILSYFLVAPLEDPQYVFYVGLQEPNLSKTKGERFSTGGFIAAPIAEEILLSTAQVLGLKKHKDSTAS